MIAQQESIAFSGNIPANYDNYLGPLFFEPFALEVAARLRPLQPAALLEIACGTGRVTRHLPKNLPAGADIVATDINPEMLAYARKMMPEGNSIIWDIADAVSLPYRNESFDCILSQFGVMFYSDRPQAYADALRTLKPGGTFVFTAWDALQFNPAARMADSTLAHFFPVDTPAFFKIPFSYNEDHLIRYELALAGFKDIRVERLSLTGYADTAENAAKGLLEGTPAHTAIVGRDEALLPLIQAELARELTAAFGATNLRVPLQALLVTARS